MLQLLLEGGEGYRDLALLLGVSEAEVRDRAGVALIAIDGDPDPLSSDLEDLLLGQLEADLAESVAAELADRPSELARVRRLHARLRLLYPAASLPVLPSGEGSGRPARPRSSQAPGPSGPVEDQPKQAPEPSALRREPELEPELERKHQPEPEPELEGRPEPQEAPEQSAPEPRPEQAVVPAATEPLKGPALSTQQKRLLALLSALGLGMVMVVLGLTGAFDGGGQATTAQDDDPAATAAGDTQLTRAVLQPQDGGEASGVAIFGAVDEQTPVLQVTAENLRPTRDGEEYSVWLTGEVPAALRLAGVEVGRNGQIATQIELPAEVLGFVVQGGFDQIDVSLNRKRAYRQEINAAENENRPTRRIGTSVLRGPITGPGIGDTESGQ